MPYKVFEANLATDKAILVDLLERNRSKKGIDYKKRIEWAYFTNPIGNAKAWIVYDEKKNKPVGFTGVFPRDIYVNGIKYRGWNCGDFSIDKAYRSLGIALMLREKAKEYIDNGVVPFLYAHPNSKMELIHLKVGHKKISNMVRYALPIRINKILSLKFRIDLIVKLISIFPNHFIMLRYLQVDTKKVKGKLLNNVMVTEDHQIIFEKMIKEFSVIGSRDVEYLIWKYEKNPNIKYFQFDLIIENVLRGTIFFNINQNTVNIVDLLIENLENYGKILITNFIFTIIKKYKKIYTISFVIQENNPFIPLLREQGFRYRDDATSTVIAYANNKNNIELMENILDGQKWFMTVGDRDT